MIGVYFISEYSFDIRRSFMICNEDEKNIINEKSVKEAPRKSKKRLINEKKIVEEFVDIAFSDETKTTDKLRALDWLSDNLSRRKKDEEIMNKLEEVLSKIESEF